MATRVVYRQPISSCHSSSPSDEELEKLMLLTNGFLNELIELVYRHRVNDDAFLADGRCELVGTRGYIGPWVH